ncbi:MAG TPA: hypothetical protein VMC79_10400 [Rectinemataceae bacterium]|nr:hypothetical protein [Rectinemataceae bacterium]
MTAPALLVLVLGSCASSVAAALGPDGGASISVSAAVPALVASKLRALAQTGETAPLFDLAAIRRSLAKEAGVSVLSLSSGSPNSLQANFSVASLSRLAASPELQNTALLTPERGPGWTGIRIRLERGEASALAKLFPGIDPYILDALSPPALEQDPVSADEYRTMLTSVLGQKAMSELDSTRVSVSLTAPATVLESGGGELHGKTLELSLPIIDILVLEKPVEFWLRWKS